MEDADPLVPLFARLEAGDDRAKEEMVPHLIPIAYGQCEYYCRDLKDPKRSWEIAKDVVKGIIFEPKTRFLSPNHLRAYVVTVARGSAIDEWRRSLASSVRHAGEVDDPPPKAEIDLPGDLRDVRIDAFVVLSTRLLEKLLLAKSPVAERLWSRKVGFGLEDTDRRCLATMFRRVRRNWEPDAVALLLFPGTARWGSFSRLLAGSGLDPRRASEILGRKRIDVYTNLLILAADDRDDEAVRLLTYVASQYFPWNENPIQKLIKAQEKLEVGAKVAHRFLQEMSGVFLSEIERRFAEPDPRRIANDIHKFRRLYATTLMAARFFDPERPVAPFGDLGRRAGLGYLAGRIVKRGANLTNQPGFLRQWIAELLSFVEDPGSGEASRFARYEGTYYSEALDDGFIALVESGSGRYEGQPGRALEQFRNVLRESAENVGERMYLQNPGQMAINLLRIAVFARVNHTAIRDDLRRLPTAIQRAQVAGHVQRSIVQLTRIRPWSSSDNVAGNRVDAAANWLCGEFLDSLSRDDLAA